MNITCVICSELFITGADAYFTQCGHVFHFHCLISWLERSKSCPQCRQRVTEKTIHKIYFNISTTESTVDATTLIHKLDNVNYTVTLKDKEIKTIKEKKNKLKEQNKLLREEVLKLENEKRSMESVIHEFKDQMTYFKTRAKETDRLADEIVKLKNVIKTMENVDAIIQGTRDQVTSILREEQNAESLALMAAILKKSLLDSEKKVRDTNYNYNRLKNDLYKLKKEHAVLETNNASLRRELQQTKLHSEKRKNILQQRLKSLGKNNIVVANSAEDSPKLTNLSDCDVLHNQSNKEPNITLNTTLTVAERIETINNSDSPYLPVKTNFGSFLETKFQAPSNSSTITSNKGYSLFKTNQKMTDYTKGTTNDEIAYDGLGGSQKIDIYPSTKPKQITLKRNKSSSTISSKKFRKLAPMANNIKITEFINVSD